MKLNEMKSNCQKYFLEKHMFKKPKIKKISIFIFAHHRSSLHQKNLSMVPVISLTGIQPLNRNSIFILDNANPCGSKCT